MSNRRCKHLKNDGICDFFENTPSLKDLSVIANEIKESYFDFRKRIDIEPPKIGYAWSSANCPFYSYSNNFANLTECSYFEL